MCSHSKRVDPSYCLNFGFNPVLTRNVFPRKKTSYNPHGDRRFNPVLTRNVFPRCCGIILVEKAVCFNPVLTRNVFPQSYTCMGAISIASGFNPVLTRNVFPTAQGFNHRLDLFPFQSCPNQECVPTEIARRGKNF